MFKNLKWLRLVPDRPGRGGTKTGIHTFQQEPVNDVRSLSGAHIYQGTWRREFSAVAYPTTQFSPIVGGSFPNPVALHGYVYPSTTDPSATPSITVLEDILQSGAVNSRYIWDVGAGVQRGAVRGGTGVPAAVFQNISGRCFIGDGMLGGMILDDRTPAIHAQRDQYLGIGTPTQALGITKAGGFVTRGSGAGGNPNLSAVGSAYVSVQAGGSPYINTPNPNSPIGTLLAGDVVTPFILDPNYAVYSFALMAPGALGGNGVTSNTTPFTATGTISITTGTSLVTLTGATWPAGGQYMGLAINFNGFSFVLLETGAWTGAFDVNGNVFALTNVQALILGVYDGPTLTNVSYTITGCQIVMPGTSTLTMTTSGTPGYSQTTHSELVQIGLNATRGAITLNLGNISFDATLDATGPNFTYQPGPKYAYAWYDPETGHMSNISPMTQVPAPVLTFTPAGLALNNLTPYFQIDNGSISYPDRGGVYENDATRFSHIIFFRTLSTRGTSTLYPIGSLSPFVGKVHPGAASTLGSWNPFYGGWLGLPNPYTGAPPLPAQPAPNFWFDFSSDSDLLLSAGFRAPQFTNEKPMVLLRGGASQVGHPYLMAYWDRRLWIVNTQEPDVLAYSCDEAQCPLGVPIESFAPTNRLRIPSVDGRAIGMRTVGDLLLITTERWAYIIAGNNESNYRLMKISTSMPGVGTYQMDEFPTLSGAEGEPTTLFYLGRDRKVYQWTLGSRVIPISQPIQDQLDQVLSGGVVLTPLAQYQYSSVHCVSAWGRRLLVVAPNAQSYQDIAPKQFPTQVHFYDIDSQTWSEGFHPNASQNAQDGLAPMATVYGLDVPANELFAILDPASNHAIVRSWLRDDTSGTPNYMTLTTFPTNFDGRKTRKQIVAMNLHATGGSWSGGMFVDEATAALAATFGAYPDPLDSIYAPVASPFDSGAQDIVIMAGQFTNPSHPIVGYRFAFVIQKNADENPAKIYALDIGYVDFEEPGDGDP